MASKLHRAAVRITVVASAVNLACDVPSDPALGSISVVVRTAGGGGDPDGYRVTLDNRVFRTLSPSGSVEFAEVGPGSHRVTLTGMAATCTATGENPRTVQLDAGEAASVEFGVGCLPSTGVMVLTVLTSGTDIDPNGYTVLVDEVPILSVGPNDDATASLATGRHDLALSGVTPNCEVVGGASQPVEILAGPATRMTVDIRCSAAPPAGRGHEILFVRSRDIEDTSEIHVVNDDGTGLRRLVRIPGLIPSDPTWAPTGDRFAFAGEDISFDSKIYLLDLEQTEPTEVPNAPEYHARSPAWSPDGRLIAFLPFFEAGGVYLISPDGSEQTHLARSEDAALTHLSWSPDASHLAVQSNDGGCHIGIIEVESNDLRLLSGVLCSSARPAWSPDGRKLAYGGYQSEFFNNEIFVLDLVDSSLTQLTHTIGEDSEPAWSPDGMRIAFTSTRDGNQEIYVMNSDGSDPVRITNDPAGDVAAAWRP